MQFDDNKFNKMSEELRELFEQRLATLELSYFNDDVLDETIQDVGELLIELAKLYYDEEDRKEDEMMPAILHCDYMGLEARAIMELLIDDNPEDLEVHSYTIAFEMPAPGDKKYAIIRSIADKTVQEFGPQLPRAIGLVSESWQVKLENKDEEFTTPLEDDPNREEIVMVAVVGPKGKGSMWIAKIDRDENGVATLGEFVKYAEEKVQANILYEYRDGLREASAKHARNMDSEDLGLDDILN